MMLPIISDIWNAGNSTFYHTNEVDTWFFSLTIPCNGHFGTPKFLHMYSIGKNKCWEGEAKEVTLKCICIAFYIALPFLNCPYQRTEDEIQVKVTEWLKSPR